MIETSEKVMVLLKRRKRTMTDFAREYGYSRQTIYKQMKSCNWREKDIKRIAELLGCDYEVVFTDKVTGAKL